jgi:MFS transporter, DHA1 family, multidrug resistance protein
LKEHIEPWRKNLFIIWAAQFLAMMGMSLVVPFLPFYIRELGVIDPNDIARWSGLVYAGPFFLSFFFTPLWGILGDKYGRKAMTTRAIFGLAISQILIGCAPNVEMLFVFRMVQGIISGFIASTLALVSASTPREKSGYAIGLLQTASSSGTVIGPFVGGSLADLFGYRLLFFIVGGICSLAGIVVVKFVQETKEKRLTSVSIDSLLENYRFSFNSKPIKIALWIIFLSQAAMVMIQPIFPLFIDSLETNKEYLATIAGAIFSITGLFMVISSPWWGKRNDSKSYRKNLKLAILGASIAYAAQGLVTNAYQLIFLRAIQGFCMGGILPSLYSYVNKHSLPERRGGIMGIASSMNILASMVGPPLGGYIAAQFGLRQNFFITGGLLFSAVFVVQYYFVDMRGSNTPLAANTNKSVEVKIFDEAN